MHPPFPSFVPTWHNDTYPAISPSRPELSAAGKTVIITGAGSGIGRATALSFARAGASRLILIGRTESTLLATQKLLTCDSAVHAVSIADEAGMKGVATAVGTWDVLVLNAGSMATPASIVESDVGDWWQTFETNVKGGMICAKVFTPTANPTRAAVVSMTAGMMLPAAMLVGLSAYMASKVALVKVLEFISAENPNIVAVSVLPGIMETDMFNKSNLPADKLPMDAIELPADFTVWLSSPEASFLDGRQVWAHWDVEELKARADEIQSGSLLTAGIHGWPHSHGNKMEDLLGLLA
ncbi:hypothetical protein FE257_012431 [Aspergillus nanangensis]|uniref:Ketoreductase domain-containing protein n=1 Tax=Aspergillus nanangensis TaxID=2582783 RepID=A0AAD4GXS1_ASPNN|nr:hypothetical protein FE257_012431 [Aspergillus nanangensis]